MAAAPEGLCPGCRALGETSERQVSTWRLRRPSELAEVEREVRRALSKATGAPETQFVVQFLEIDPNDNPYPPHGPYGILVGYYPGTGERGRETAADIGKLIYVSVRGGSNRVIRSPTQWLSGRFEWTVALS